MSDVVVWSAGIVIPITAPSILDGAVAVRDGRIEHVGARGWVIDTLTQRGLAFTERHFDGVLLPGLVNAHTHLQYTGMASVGAGQYRGFDSWARAFDEVYDAGGLDWGGDAAEGARLLLCSGMTAAADVVTDAAAASALHDAGLHGVAYWEVMGWSNKEWKARGEREVSASLDAMLTPPGVGISPHAPYSLDAEPLLDLPDMARRRGMRIHIHLGESHSEAEWSETRTTTLADLWKSEHSSSFTAMRSRGGGFSSTQFVDQLGVLGPDCHVAHGVYMRADDRRRLRARQTAVALCPRSNRVIGLDAPPVAAYLTEGNMIAVGTDSLSSSPPSTCLRTSLSSSIWRKLRGIRTRTWRAASFRRRPWAVPPRWAWRRVPTAWVSSSRARSPTCASSTCPSPRSWRPSTPWPATVPGASSRPSCPGACATRPRTDAFVSLSLSLPFPSIGASYDRRVPAD